MSDCGECQGWPLHDWVMWLTNTSQCSRCGARRDDLATPAPLDVERLARALCSAIDAHFVSDGLVAAIAAAYAEEAT